MGPQKNRDDLDSAGDYDGGVDIDDGQGGRDSETELGKTSRWPADDYSADSRGFLIRWPVGS